MKFSEVRIGIDKTFVGPATNTIYILSSYIYTPHTYSRLLTYLFADHHCPQTPIFLTQTTTTTSPTSIKNRSLIATRRGEKDFGHDADSSFDNAVLE